MISKISKDKLNIHYTVLDDLRKDMHEDVLAHNPLVEKIIDDLENDPGTKGDITDEHNMALFKTGKHCFRSINYQKMVDPLQREEKYVAR